MPLRLNRDAETRENVGRTAARTTFSIRIHSAEDEAFVSSTRLHMQYDDGSIEEIALEDVDAVLRTDALDAYTDTDVGAGIGVFFGVILGIAIILGVIFLATFDLSMNFGTNGYGGYGGQRSVW